MNAMARKQLGLRPTVNDLVADTIERECLTRMSPPLRIDRMQAEALAYVAIRRVRAEDRRRTRGRP